MKFSGKRLEVAIAERGLSLREVARSIGKSYSAVNSWTLGDSAPNSNDLAKLTVALDKSLSYFFMDNDSTCQNAPEIPSAAQGDS